MSQYVDFSRCLAMGTTRISSPTSAPAPRVQRGARLGRAREGFDRLLGRFRSQNAAELELGELMNEILAIGRRYRARPLADMALVMVAMVTAEGIGKQLNPHANLFLDTAAFLGPLLAKKSAAASEA